MKSFTSLFVVAGLSSPASPPRRMKSGSKICPLVSWWCASPSMARTTRPRPAIWMISRCRSLGRSKLLAWQNLKCKRPPITSPCYRPMPRCRFRLRPSSKSSAASLGARAMMLVLPATLLLCPLACLWCGSGEAHAESGPRPHRQARGTLSLLPRQAAARNGSHRASARWQGAVPED